MNLKLNMIRVAAALMIAASAPCEMVLAQENDTLRIAVRSDGSVFIYHSVYLAPGYGFNIYRKDARGGERKLNESPVVGAMSGGEFRSIVGAFFRELQSAFKEASAPEILASLRSSPVDARLYAFTHPEVARALGRVFVDSTAPAGSRVTYRIAVTDAFGNETGESHEKSAHLVPHRLRAPTKVTLTNREDLVTLQWNYPVPSKDGDDFVIRFEVLQRDSLKGETRINEGVILRNAASELQTFTFRARNPDEVLEIAVRAVDITGQVGPPGLVLNTVLRDKVPPAPPVDVRAGMIDGGTVEVTWPVSVENDAAGYHVYRSPGVDDQASLSRLTQRPLGLLQTLFRDTTLPSGRGAWFYRVSAIDRSGNESKPSNAASIIVEDRSAPPAPSGLTAEFLRNRTVRLRWQSPDRPRDFQTFIIMRKKLVGGAPDVATRINTADVQETSFIDAGEAGEGFQEGATYRYWVSAADSTRNVSNPIMVDIIIPRLTPPSAPLAVRAYNDQGIRVVLTWSAPETKEIALFVVHRLRQGERDTVRARIAGNRREYRDESISKAATYVYWVTALDSVGNESKPSVRETIFVRDFNAPRSVRNIRADETDEGILIRWEPVPDSITGYRVFRASVATGVYVEITSALIRETKWLDRKGKAGDWYRVQAYDLSGNESAPARPAQALARGSRRQ